MTDYIIKDDGTNMYNERHSKYLGVDGDCIEVEIDGDSTYFFPTKEELDRLIIALQNARKDMD